MSPGEGAAHPEEDLIQHREVCGPEILGEDKTVPYRSPPVSGLQPPAFSKVNGHCTKEVVGILALQGDFADHAEALARLGLPTREVRQPGHLAGLSGLVLPGGESTTIMRLLRIEGLWQPLQALVAGGLPTLATCAGMILLARRVTHPVQESLGLLDLTVVRNGYGRQVHSGTHRLTGPGLPPGTEGVFIRAPRIIEVGPAVQVLAWRDEDPVLVQQGTILAAGFHPEMQPDHPVTHRFAELVRQVR